MAQSSGLRAGAAMVDITPKAGTHLSGSGMGEHRPAQSVLDPLFAKALVPSASEKKLCLVVLDTCILTEDFTARIRRAAGERFGFDPNAVMLHALQIHSAPSCGRFMLDPDFPLETTPENEYLWGCESSYIELAERGALEAIARAHATLVPVQIGYASGIRGDLAFNRRGITREGTIAMPWPAGQRVQPLGPNYLRYMEGPIDPEVGVLCLRTDDLRMVAMLLHYTCHPVNVFANPSAYHSVSADWPGAWCSGMQSAYGPACVPIVVNGCCGNINPWDPYDPGYIPDHRRMGAALADMASRVAASITFSETSVLDWRLRTVPLDYREVPKKRLDEVEQILSGHLQPQWLPNDPGRIDPKWFHAASTRSIEYCRHRHEKLPYELQVLRIGPAAIVGMPGEPFVEGQLAIKLASPSPATFMAHCTTQYVGYLPTREAAARGGHEANAEHTYWAKLAPGSLETVCARAVEMLRELFA